MRVPLFDLEAHLAPLRRRLDEAVAKVIDGRRFIHGPEIARLEERLAAYCEVRHAVGVSSGTDALIMSLLSEGIGPGDEVLTSAYSFFASAGSIWRVGARPVFVDIDPETYNLAPAELERALTERTRAVLPVHLFGQTAEMDPVIAFAESHDLVVIEDAAQALGSRYRGARAGTMGRYGCFSFYPTKNLGALGDAGLVVTSEDDAAERLRKLRDHGESERYRHEIVGGNFRMDSIQAAVLLVMLDSLEEWHQARRDNAKRYDERLAAIEGVSPLRVRDHDEAIFNQYVVRVPERGRCAEFLRERGVGTAVYYPLALHQQPCFSSLGYRGGEFPEAERAARESLALPIYPELTEAQIDYVADTLAHAARSLARSAS